MRAEKHRHLVAKNSGGEATYAKIDAARIFGMTVIMVSRPTRARGAARHSTMFAALAWIEAHRAAP